MTYQQWLHDAEQKLSDAGIGTSHLDSLLLLEFVTNQDRTSILAHPERRLEPIKQKQLNKLLRRRMRHEPMAQIRGYSEFYGHTFVITPAVLEPRPESETMIDRLKWLIDSSKNGLHDTKQLRIADVGTGSGALGICAQLLLPKSQVQLLDIDTEALRIAKRNVDLFTLNISIIKSDLLSASKDNLDILLCNLPYVPDDYHVNEAALREPKVAIFGGPDGLNLYRKLFKQVQNRTQKPLYIFTESLPPQHDKLDNIASASDYQKVVEDDFITLFRLRS